MGSSKVKRNEKNGIVCFLCLQPESVENPCEWFCHGFCQRSFHQACKDELFKDSQQKRAGLPLIEPLNKRDAWQCDDCLEGQAECYCCKQKGMILVFPKKGKPKAAGSTLNKAALKSQDL